MESALMKKSTLLNVWVLVMMLIQIPVLGQAESAAKKSRVKADEVYAQAFLAREAQQQLKNLGYYKGRVDGILGPRSLVAINAFQQETYLPVTGQLDAKTVEYLNRPILILNTQDFPPLQYRLNPFGSRLYGPAPKAIRAACLQAQLTCILRLYEDWGEAQRLVKQHTAHGMFLIGWNAKRATFLHRSIAVADAEYGFFVKQDDPLNFTDIADLDGYPIGVYAPSNVATTLQTIGVALQAQGKRIRITETRDDKPLFYQLATENSAFDAVFSNKDSGMTVIKGEGIQGLRYTGPYKTLQYDVGFSKHLVHPSLVERFKQAFKALQDDGTIRQIYANAGLGGTVEDATPSAPRVKTAQPPTGSKPDRYHLAGIGNSPLIEDTKTSLVWQKKGSDRATTFADAQDYVKSLNVDQYGGHQDWRLPSTEELRSLVEPIIQTDNRLYIAPIFSATQQTCWSQDGSRDSQQFVDFFEGRHASKDQLDSNYVRVVRGVTCRRRS